MRLICKSQILELIQIQFHFFKAIQSTKFEKCIETMKEELKSMEENKVWDIVDLLECAR